MQKKHRKNFLVAGLIFLLSACNAKDPTAVVFPPTLEASQPDTMIPNTGTSCENLLFPVRMGASWTYHSTGSPSGEFIYTDTISEIRADGFTMTTQVADTARTVEWSCLSEGLRALQIGGGTTASISTQDIAAEFTTLEASGVSLPREVTPGQQWQHNLTIQGSIAMPNEEGAPSNGTVSVSMQETGRETITISAGTFEAVKIQAATIIQISADFQGMPVPITINSSSILWYAPNVGFIKSIESSDFNGTSYTTTTELQSYSIP